MCRTVWSILLVSLVLPPAVQAQTSAEATRTAVMHPLDALTAGEITTAVEVLRTAGRLGPQARFGLLDLAEPEKAAVAEGMRTGTFGRAARAIIYDWATDRVSEAVDLTSRTVVSVEERPGGQPPMRHLVISRINEILKSDTAWLSAVRAPAGAGATRGSSSTGSSMSGWTGAGR